MINLKNKYQRSLFIAICVLVVLLIIIMVMRVYAYIELRERTNEQATPTVTMIKAERAPATEIIMLPGNVQGWHDATIYARTNGYVKKWLVDIGSLVKANQLLAIIEAPEVDAALRQAEADVKSAIANDKLAQITAKRWVKLLRTDSVSRQETDEKVSSAKATHAALKAARANRDRLRDLVSFERIKAPFDGIITNRSTDIGSLINSGSNTAAPLFHIVKADPLRIYVNVPQNYAARINRDMVVTLTFSQHPGKTYPARLLETAKAIAPATRTLLTQFMADNKNYELFPGGYTEVHFRMPVPSEIVRLPVNTLLFRAQGLQVATVDKNNQVVLKKITISRDFGNFVEVNTGVKPGEAIIINPPDAIFVGEKVRIAQNTKKKDGDNNNENNNGQTA
jgi:membrane fusion protein (multidrug efflux system)